MAEAAGGSAAVIAGVSAPIARAWPRLEAIGRTPPFVDDQIAAITATNGLILVTSNTADFAPFDGLQVEDWRV